MFPPCNGVNATKYGDPIQFEPTESAVQLRGAEKATLSRQSILLSAEVFTRERYSGSSPSGLPKV